jgi:cholesterol transport system auxiliary component
MNEPPRRAAPVLPALAALAALAGCGGLFQTREPAFTVYELRPAAPTAAATRLTATLAVARPRARPGLDSDRIAVTLPGQRLDAYGGARWSAPLPELVESLLVAGLREAGGWQAVVAERDAFGGRYLLETDIEAFEADYGAGGAAPTVHVRLSGQLGLAAERRLVASFEGSATVAAAADHQREVVAAFARAFADAAQQLIAAADAAAAGDAGVR